MPPTFSPFTCNHPPHRLPIGVRTYPPLDQKLNHKCLACEKAQVETALAPIRKAFFSYRNSVAKGEFQTLCRERLVAEMAGRPTGDLTDRIEGLELEVKSERTKTNNGIKSTYVPFEKRWGTQSDAGLDIIKPRSATSEIDEDILRGIAIDPNAFLRLGQ